MATIGQKIKLATGLFRGNWAKNGPFYVDIDLTERCNLNCLGCPYHNLDNKLIRELKDIPQDMPLDVFKRICAQLKEMKTHTLIFQGTGEPFLHPHLIDCVRTSKELGFYTILFTNGTLLHTDIIQALSDVRLDILKISLWATSEEQFSQNYPGTNPNNFEKVLDGLKRLGDLRAQPNRLLFKVQTHFIINNTNFLSLKDMIDLAEIAGSRCITFSPMVDLRDELKPILLSPEQIDRFQKSLKQKKQRIESNRMEHNIDEICLRYDLGHAVWKELPCYVTWYHARIRADGTVQPCGRCNPDIEFGNVHTNTFKDIWNGPLIREFRAKTRTSKGLASLQRSCQCQYCCFVEDNLKIHRAMRWKSLFSTGKKTTHHDKQSR
jgi:radical SAM protein with 4Fe4S-binding SPASM domain